MSTDKEAIARRAVACKGWRWMAGMRDVDGSRVYDDREGLLEVVSIDTGDLDCQSDRFAFDSPSTLELPDLDDPATLGCLLALVREAWGDPTISAAPVPSFDHGCSWRISMTGTDQERLFMNLGGRLWRLTEAEALVAALEAAP